MSVEGFALLFGTGLGVGIVSALFGVGGGIVIVPFLVLALGVDQQLAEGTSLLALLPGALTGAIAHSRRGYVSAKHAALLGLGGASAAAAGALLALSLPDHLLARGFGVLLALVGVRTVRRGWAMRAQRATALHST